MGRPLCVLYGIVVCLHIGEAHDELRALCGHGMQSDGRFYVRRHLRRSTAHHLELRWGKQLRWDAANGKWAVAFLGTNLTNKEYYVSLFDLRAFGEGMESGQPGAPREWAVTVHYKF